MYKRTYKHFYVYSLRFINENKIYFVFKIYSIYIYIYIYIYISYYSSELFKTNNIETETEDSNTKVVIDYETDKPISYADMQ
jgi:hypothetical protein